jgi:phosphoribosylamine--glycine ligase/phosphoribosylformylglycinamidine cyclo-ligase
MLKNNKKVERMKISTSKRRSATTYAHAGVHVDAGNTLVDKIKPLALATARLGTKAALGDFGGLFDLSHLNYKDPILVSGTDGVGTKLKIAQQVKCHNTIGIDLVAMCVNDLIVHAAEPLFFLDYFACGKLNIKDAESVIAGIAQGCKESNCSLIGGETAEMPGMYAAGEYDLAGFAVGIVERSQLLPKRNDILAGDIVIGLASSGLHSNGYSLVRYLIAQNNIDIHAAPEFETPHQYLYQALLEPTRLYVKSLLPLMHNGLIKAAAHITGGGLLENIPRVIPDNLGVVIDPNNWNIPQLFNWISQEGTIKKEEMFRTFNMGIGMVIISAPENAHEIMKTLQIQETVYQIGKVATIKNIKKRVTIV